MPCDSLAIPTLRVFFWGGGAAFAVMSLINTNEASITVLTCCLSMTKPLTL